MGGSTTIERARAVVPLRRVTPRTVVVVAALMLWRVGAASAQALEESVQNPIAGSYVFGVKGCVKCHAVNGLGGSVGPDLGQISRRRSFYELAAAMWNHLPQMAERMREMGIERPHLDAREVGDLIGFLFTLDYFDNPGDVDAGRRLFVDKQCVVCHQVGGFGGVIGPSLDFLSEYGSPIFVAAAMWNHGPAMQKEMTARGVTRQTFKDAELIDLIAYLQSVSDAPPQGPLYVLPGRPDAGRETFAEKGCVECHSVRGEGGRIGPDLAERARQLSETEFAAAMWNKAPTMVAAMQARGMTVPNLSAAEMSDIVAYLYSVQYFAESGDPARGRRRLSEKGCLACHSADGRGGDAAPDFARLPSIDSPAGVTAALWNHSLLMERGLDALEIPWPTFSPTEMADLAAFLSLTPGG